MPAAIDASPGLKGSLINMGAHRPRAPATLPPSSFLCSFSPGDLRHPLCPCITPEGTQGWQRWQGETGSSQDCGQESVIISEEGDSALPLKWDKGNAESLTGLVPG